MEQSTERPVSKPANPNFSSGPCAKRPGWSYAALDNALLGRSHRSGEGKKKLKAVIERHRALLGIPDDYLIGIVPASDTGAIEMALWSMLGARGVDVLAWEAFSQDWLKDIRDHLGLSPQIHKADYGALPDLSQVDFDHDVVFVWNGTTSGVCVPDGDWIPSGRAGLTFCDATSAVFAYDMPWDKLDVVTWSWQKVLGGEGAHGMLVLSPRAVERLETYTPPRPLPKIFRMTKGGKVNQGIFEGLTINTPSMMAVEDCLDALDWVEKIGGLPETMRRSRANFDAVSAWVEKTPWAAFLAGDPATRSTTAICLTFTDPWFAAMDEDARTAVIGRLCKLLEAEHVAYDIKHYRDAPPGLRIWGGATIESGDVAALMPWVEWAYGTIKAQEQRAAA